MRFPNPDALIDWCHEHGPCVSSALGTTCPKRVDRETFKNAMLLSYFDGRYNSFADLDWEPLRPVPAASHLTVEFDRTLRLTPGTPLILAADRGFAPLSEIWQDLDDRGMAQQVNALCDRLNQSHHVLVAGIALPPEPKAYLLLTPSTESRVYVHRWSKRRTWRSSLWLDFLYSVTYAAARLALQFSPERTLRLGHLTSGGWPAEAALASLEALHHLSASNRLNRCLFGGCCIEPDAPGRYWAQVLMAPPSFHEPLAVAPVEDTASLQVVRVSVPIRLAGGRSRRA